MMEQPLCGHDSQWFGIMTEIDQKMSWKNDTDVFGDVDNENIEQESREQQH